MRSAAMSAWRSENVRTRSGFSARILLIFAEVKALTQGFSRRACGGRTTYPEMPTMRSCSPSRYSVSTVSSVRQTIRLGGNWRMADDMTNYRRVVTVAITRDVIAGHSSLPYADYVNLSALPAIHHFRKMH